MAISFKKVKVEPAPTPEEEAAMVAAGLLEPKPKVGGIQIKRKGHFRVGDRVRVTQNLFTWVKYYQPGDIGIIESASVVSVKLQPTDPAEALYRVRLDHPRSPEHETVIFSGRELAVIQ